MANYSGCMRPFFNVPHSSLCSIIHDKIFRKLPTKQGSNASSAILSKHTITQGLLYFLYSVMDRKLRGSIICNTNKIYMVIPPDFTCFTTLLQEIKEHRNIR